MKKVVIVSFPNHSIDNRFKLICGSIEEAIGAIEGELEGSQINGEESLGIKVSFSEMDELDFANLKEFEGF